MTYIIKQGQTLARAFKYYDNEVYDYTDIPEFISVLKSFGCNFSNSEYN